MSRHSQQKPLDSSDSLISQQIGRTAAGAQAVLATRPDGTPIAVRVAGVVDGRPFPSLFWLTDPEIATAISRLESKGVTHELQRQADTDPTFQNAMRNDHLAFIATKEKLLTSDEREHLNRLQCLDDFLRKGIGGVANFQRVRCLHAWLAAHLFQPNSIGGIVIDALKEQFPFLKASTTNQMPSAADENLSD